MSPVRNAISAGPPAKPGAVGTGGAAVDQVVVQEAVTRFVVGEGEDVVYGPGRPGARSEIEFYVVFVQASQASSKKGLSCMQATQRRSWLLV